MEPHSGRPRWLKSRGLPPSWESGVRTEREMRAAYALLLCNFVVLLVGAIVFGIVGVAVALSANVASFLWWAGDEIKHAELARLASEPSD